MREPTSAEKMEIARYLQSQCGDATEPGYGTEIADRSWIGVADGYCSDGPGYVGKVIAIIYPAGPETHDILCYNENGELYRAISEREVVLPRQTLQEIHDEDEQIEKLFGDLREKPPEDEWKQQLATNQ